MKKVFILLSLSFLFTACNQKTEMKEPSNKTETSQETKESTSKKNEDIVIPPTPESFALVNNKTPIPKGYRVETTYLKKPLMVDLNGDGKLDAFRVLKNPNKIGMKYLFEFRIADSDQVYYYENDDQGYDLDTFGNFEIAHKGEKIVDVMKLDNGDITPFENASEKARIILKNDAITVNVLEETCASSLFYLENNKINRVFLC